MSKHWKPLAAVAAVIIILTAVFGGLYNSLNSALLDVDAKWSQVENLTFSRS